MKGEERCAHHSVYREEGPEQSLSSSLFLLQLFLADGPRDIILEEQVKEEARQDFLLPLKTMYAKGLRTDSCYQSTENHRYMQGPQSRVMDPLRNILITKMAFHKPSVGPSN